MRVDRVRLLLIPAAVGAGLALWGALDFLDFRPAEAGRRFLAPGVYLAVLAALAVFTFEPRPGETGRWWIIAPVGCALLLLAAVILFAVGLQIR